MLHNPVSFCKNFLGGGLPKQPLCTFHMQTQLVFGVANVTMTFLNWLFPHSSQSFLGDAAPIFTSEKA